MGHHQKIRPRRLKQGKLFPRTIGGNIADLRIYVEPATLSGLQAMLTDVLNGLPGILTQVQTIVATAHLSNSAQLDRIEAQGVTMRHTVDDLLAETKRQTTLTASLTAYVAGIKQQLIDQGLDPDKVEQAFIEMAGNDDAVAAIIANTPAAPPEGQPVP